MTELRRRLTRYARWQAAFAAVALLLAGGFYLFGFRAAAADLAAARAQTAAVRQELAGRRPGPDAGGLPIETLRTRLRASPRLSDPREPELFIRDLTQLGEQSGLRRLTVRADAPRKTDLLCELRVVLTGRGNFLDACSFLRQAEQLPWLTRVKNLHLRSSERADGEVDVRVDLKAYSSEE